MGPTELMILQWAGKAAVVFWTIAVLRHFFPRKK